MENKVPVLTLNPEAGSETGNRTDRGADGGAGYEYAQ